MEGRYGAAADIGTTTVVLKLFDLKTGACIGEAGMLNPQTAVAADVMGRIGAALNGELEEINRKAATPAPAEPASTAKVSSAMDSASA